MSGDNGPVDWARHRDGPKASVITFVGGARGSIPLADARTELLAEIETAERHIVEWTERHAELQAEANKAARLRDEAFVQMQRATDRLRELHRRIVRLFPLPPGAQNTPELGPPQPVEER